MKKIVISAIPLSAIAIFAALLATGTLPNFFKKADEFTSSLIADAMEQKDSETELANIKLMVLQLDPSISSLTGEDNKLRLAMKLRDLVYKRVPVSNQWRGIDWNNIDNFVYLALASNDKGLLCQGLSAVYSLILTSFGIEHRNVAMFETVDPLGSNHASVEVSIDGKWVAMDPTFNVSFSGRDGSLLSWGEVGEVCESGANVEPLFGPQSPADNRSNILTYYATICSLTKFMVWSPTNSEEGFTVPNEWDGVVEAKNGPYSFVNQFLNSMPWTVHRQVEMTE